MSVHFGGRGPGHMGRTSTPGSSPPPPASTGQLKFNASAQSGLLVLLEDI